MRGWDGAFVSGFRTDQSDQGRSEGWKNLQNFLAFEQTWDSRSSFNSFSFFSLVVFPEEKIANG